LKEAIYKTQAAKNRQKYFSTTLKTAFIFLFAKSIEKREERGRFGMVLSLRTAKDTVV